jgi:imidazolonepropionase-like amidohydrolase
LRRLATFLAGVAALAAVPGTAQTVAITGGRVVIGDGSPPIDGGTVVIRDGRVVAAGANVAVPANAERIDASGRWVTPGVVAGFSRIGLLRRSRSAAPPESPARSSRRTPAARSSPARVR